MPRSQSCKNWDDKYQNLSKHVIQFNGMKCYYLCVLVHRTQNKRCRPYNNRYYWTQWWNYQVFFGKNHGSNFDWKEKKSQQLKKNTPTSIETNTTSILQLMSISTLKKQNWSQWQVMKGIQRERGLAEGGGNIFKR